MPSTEKCTRCVWSIIKPTSRLWCHNFTDVALSHAPSVAANLHTFSPHLDPFQTLFKKANTEAPSNKHWLLGQDLATLVIYLFLQESRPREHRVLLLCSRRTWLCALWRWAADWSSSFRWLDAADTDMKELHLCKHVGFVTQRCALVKEGPTFSLWADILLNMQLLCLEL